MQNLPSYIIKVSHQSTNAFTDESASARSVMRLVKIEVPTPSQIASVMTLESREELGLKKGDEVEVVVKAVNVLLIRH